MPEKKTKFTLKDYYLYLDLWEQNKIDYEKEFTGNVASGLRESQANDRATPHEDIGGNKSTGNANVRGDS